MWCIVLAVREYDNRYKREIVVESRVIGPFSSEIEAADHYFGESSMLRQQYQEYLHDVQGGKKGVFELGSSCVNIVEMEHPHK